MHQHETWGAAARALCVAPGGHFGGKGDGMARVTGVQGLLQPTLMAIDGQNNPKPLWSTNGIKNKKTTKIDYFWQKIPKYCVFLSFFFTIWLGPKWSMGDGLLFLVNGGVNPQPTPIRS